MGNELKIVPGGGNLAEIAHSRSNTTGTNRMSGPKTGSDQISLSRLYTAVQSNEAAMRLQNLELQVSKLTYRIPAEDISNSIISENLIAA